MLLRLVVAVVAGLALMVMVAQAVRIHRGQRALAAAVAMEAVQALLQPEALPVLALALAEMVVLAAAWVQMVVTEVRELRFTLAVAVVVLGTEQALGRVAMAATTTAVAAAVHRL
jgi:hypothetical protein